MNENGKKEGDKSTWAIGGGVLTGLGVGFFFLPAAPLAFVGSLLVGLGLGLVVTSVFFGDATELTGPIQIRVSAEVPDAPRSSLVHPPQIRDESACARVSSALS